MFGMKDTDVGAGGERVQFLALGGTSGGKEK